MDTETVVKENEEDDTMSTLSDELTDLHRMTASCLDRLGWRQFKAEAEKQTDETVIDSLFVRCRQIRQDLLIILDAVKKL